MSSDMTPDKFADRVVAVLSEDGLTVNDFLHLDAVPDRFKEELCVRAVAVVLRADLAGIIERNGSAVIKDSLPAPIAALVQGAVMNGLSKSIAEAIKKQLLENGREIIMPLIEEEFGELGKEPVSNLLGNIFESEEGLRLAVKSAYLSFQERTSGEGE